MSSMTNTSTAENTGRQVSDEVASAARWFWWIAGLSLVNTALTMSGSDTHFVVGMAITTIVDVVLENFKIIALVFDLLVIGFFLLMGWFAIQGKKWAFYVGAVVYMGDGLICLLLQDWMSVGFHVFALIFIIHGLVTLHRES